MALHSTEPAYTTWHTTGVYDIRKMLGSSFSLSLFKYGNTRRYAEFEIDQNKTLHSRFASNIVANANV